MLECFTLCDVVKPFESQCSFRRLTLSGNDAAGKTLQGKTLP